MRNLPLWSVGPRERSLGVEEKSSVSSGVLSAATLPARRRSCRASVLHVCAHAYHTKCVIGTGVLWSKSPSQRAGCSPENLQFSGLRVGVLGEYVVRVRVRTYAARELRFFGMYSARVLRDACCGLCSLSFAYTTVFVSFPPPTLENPLHGLCIFKSPSPD